MFSKACFGPGASSWQIDGTLSEKVPNMYYLDEAGWVSNGLLESVLVTEAGLPADVASSDRTQGPAKGPR